MTIEVSRKILNMGLLCAALVVTRHVFLTGPVGSVAWLIEQIVIDGIAQIAVPFFFVASGCLLARHFGEPGWWGKECRKRVFSLLVPYLIWSFIFVVIGTPVSIASDYVAGRTFGTSIWYLHSFDWVEVRAVERETKRTSA